MRVKDLYNGEFTTLKKEIEGNWKKEMTPPHLCWWWEESMLWNGWQEQSSDSMQLPSKPQWRSPQNGKAALKFVWKHQPNKSQFEKSQGHQTSQWISSILQTKQENKGTWVGKSEVMLFRLSDCVVSYVSQKYTHADFYLGWCCFLLFLVWFWHQRVLRRCSAVPVKTTVWLCLFILFPWFITR